MSQQTLAEKGWGNSSGNSRGKKVTKEVLDNLVDGLDIPNFEKSRLKKLSPNTYIGLAEKLARKV